MATLGPQIVSQSYGNLLKFLPTGEAGVTTNQVQITDGKGKVTPLFLSTGSAYVSGALSASAEVVFSGLTSNAPGQYVSFDTTTGRLYYSATSSIQNVVSASFATSASSAISASYSVTASFATSASSAVSASYSVTASFATSASYSVTSSFATSAVSASWAPNDGDWTIGSSFMTASGKTSVYIPDSLENGLTNNAQGAYSHAEGANTIAIGGYSHAEGRQVSASGEWSHAEGNKTKAQQNYSHAEGDETISYGLAAHAEGWNTLASGTYSHAEGQSTEAVGVSSHAEGASTRAEGWFSHAEGGNTIAIGNASHAGGRHTTASLVGQTVVGQYNVGTYLNGNDTFVVGTGVDNNTRADAFKVRADTHEVILKQQNPGSINPNNGPGLYFGEPNTNQSTRIISTQAFGVGILYLQGHDGTQYNSMVDVSNTVTAIFA